MSKKYNQGSGNKQASVLSGAAMHYRDVNSKDIFNNKLLTSQFLRNYTGFPVFSDVKPEDIEDVTEHYKAYLGVELHGDSIKKIRVRIGGIEQEIFMISILEHKSYVDYDVSMQIFHYASVIWRQYAAEQRRIYKDKNINKRKKFRYPLIIPVVYYEGKAPWTADFQLKDRIEYSEVAGDLIPDYRYILVQIQGFSNAELIEHGDEMAVVMMINKVQTKEDFSQFLKDAGSVMEKVFKHAPEDVRKLLLDVIWTLLMRMRVPVDEAEELMQLAEDNEMGKLFANMEPMDIQKERANTAREKKRADQAEERADKAEERADQAEERADQAEERADKAEERADKAEQEVARLKKQLMEYMK